MSYPPPMNELGSKDTVVINVRPAALSRYEMKRVRASLECAHDRLVANYLHHYDMYKWGSAGDRRYTAAKFEYSVEDHKKIADQTAEGIQMIRNLLTVATKLINPNHNPRGRRKQQ